MFIDVIYCIYCNLPRGKIQLHISVYVSEHFPFCNYLRTTLEKGLIKQSFTTDVSYELLHRTHVSEEHVLFDISCVSLRWQHHLARGPCVCKVEELPLVLVALVGLQVFLPAIQGAASDCFLKDVGQSVLHYSSLFFMFLFSLKNDCICDEQIIIGRLKMLLE